MGYRKPERTKEREAEALRKRFANYQDAPRRQRERRKRVIWAGLLVAGAAVGFALFGKLQ
jgi:hypothetical protein